jgi:hypothetical protein
VNTAILGDLTRLSFMKTLILALALVPAFFYFGLLVGKSMDHKKQMQRENKISAVDELGQAVSFKIALAEIREKRITNATETLEFGLDCGVQTLWNLREKSDNSLKRQIDQQLKMIKLYREKWPRQIESDLSSEYLSAIEIRATVDKSKEILNKVSD